MNFNWLHALLMILLLGLLQLIVTSLSQQNSGIANKVRGAFDL